MYPVAESHVEQSGLWGKSTNANMEQSHRQYQLTWEKNQSSVTLSHSCSSAAILVCLYSSYTWHFYWDTTTSQPYVGARSNHWQHFPYLKRISR